MTKMNRIFRQHLVIVLAGFMVASCSPSKFKLSDLNPFKKEEKIDLGPKRKPIYNPGGSMYGREEALIPGQYNPQKNMRLGTPPPMPAISKTPMAPAISAPQSTPPSPFAPPSFNQASPALPVMPQPPEVMPNIQPPIDMPAPAPEIMPYPPTSGATLPPDVSSNVMGDRPAVPLEFKPAPAFEPGGTMPSYEAPVVEPTDETSKKPSVFGKLFGWLPKPTAPSSMNSENQPKMEPAPAPTYAKPHAHMVITDQGVSARGPSAANKALQTIDAIPAEDWVEEPGEFPSLREVPQAPKSFDDNVMQKNQEELNDLIAKRNQAQATLDNLYEEQQQQQSENVQLEAKNEMLKQQQHEMMIKERAIKSQLQENLDAIKAERLAIEQQQKALSRPVPDMGTTIAPIPVPASIMPPPPIVQVAPPARLEETTVVPAFDPLPVIPQAALPINSAPTATVRPYGRARSTLPRSRYADRRARR